MEETDLKKECPFACYYENLLGWGFKCYATTEEEKCDGCPIEIVKE